MGAGRGCVCWQVLPALQGVGGRDRCAPSQALGSSYCRSGDKRARPHQGWVLRGCLPELRGQGVLAGDEPPVAFLSPRIPLGTPFLCTVWPHWHPCPLAAMIPFCRNLLGILAVRVWDLQAQRWGLFAFSTDRAGVCEVSAPWLYLPGHNQDVLLPASPQNKNKTKPKLESLRDFTSRIQMSSY